MRQSGTAQAEDGGKANGRVAVAHQSLKNLRSKDPPLYSSSSCKKSPNSRVLIFLQTGQSHCGYSGQITKKKYNSCNFDGVRSGRTKRAAHAPIRLKTTSPSPHCWLCGPTALRNNRLDFICSELSDSTICGSAQSNRASLELLPRGRHARR